MTWPSSNSITIGPHILQVTSLMAGRLYQGHLWGSRKRNIGAGVKGRQKPTLPEVNRVIPIITTSRGQN